MNDSKLIKDYADILYQEFLLNSRLSYLRWNALLILSDLDASGIDSAHKIFQELIKKGENDGTRKVEEENY